MGSVLAICSVGALDCRRPVPEQASAETEKSADMSDALVAREATDLDKDARPETRPNAPAATPGTQSEWEIAHQRERERIQRERQTRARADWQMTLRTDTPKIVPCQPLCVTIAITNKSGIARKRREVLGGSQVFILAGRKGDKPQVVVKGVDVELVPVVPPNNEGQLVSAGASMFVDHMLTVERVDGGGTQNADGSWSRTPDAKRIFSEPGQYEVYVAIVDSFDRFEVLRSGPLAVTVREPTESELPYVEFFRDGRQIPPHYGFSKVDEEAFDKLRELDEPEGIVAFQRKVDAETIDNLRATLAKHPDPPVADDMRHYLMMLLFRSARKYDERGRHIGTDRDVLAEAAQVYLDIDPERKQLRRRSIKRWHGLSSHQYPLEEARPIFQILASWKTWSPFYEDEVESQAALAKIMYEIEAPLIQQARQRAAAPPPKPKPKLPTD